MSRRTVDPDEQASNVNLIEEFLAKAGNSSLRNSKEEKERQNEVISYGGGLSEGNTDPDDSSLGYNIDGENLGDCCDKGESISTSDIRNSDSGFSTTNTNIEHGGNSDVSCTPKRSCFIDASTLYDETEYDSLPTTTAPCTSHSESSPFRASIGSSSSGSSSSQPRSGDSRQENEKRQGYLVFKNSIHQYSGHPISATSATNSSSREADDFEIVDFPEENGTPQNSLAYIPTAAHDDDRGRVEEAAPILTASELYSTRSQPKRHQKHDEMAPIISGGSSFSDFKPADSPSVRRRTEMCPIVSGGFCDTDLPVERKEPKKRSSSVTSASWVVDVSSLKGAHQTNEVKNDYSSLKYTRESNSPKPSLSFYVNLEPEKEKPKDALRDFENPKSLQLTKSTGFFIDLSGDKVNDKKKVIVPEPVVMKKQVEESDTKNIFSMFIDFGENKKPKSATPRLNSSFSNKSLESSFKGATQPVPCQRDNKEIVDVKVQRPTTLSEKSEIEDKPQTIEVSTPSPSTDKHSQTSDSFTSNTNSHDGAPGKKRQDAKINETFDKSSLGSLTDGILSKDLSPISSTETDDATFQRDSDGSFVPKKSDTDSNQSFVKSQESDMQSAMHTLQARIEIQKQQLLDTPTNDSGAGAFVKLSDMDKQPKSITGVEDTQFSKTRGKGMSASAGMTGIKKHNWLADLNHGTELSNQTNLSPSEGNVNSIPLASSVENSKSLSRLFPHLSDGEKLSNTF